MNGLQLKLAPSQSKVNRFPAEETGRAKDSKRYIHLGIPWASVGSRAISHAPDMCSVVHRHPKYSIHLAASRLTSAESTPCTPLLPHSVLSYPYGDYIECSKHPLRQRAPADVLTRSMCMNSDYELFCLSQSDIMLLKAALSSKGRDVQWAMEGNTVLY